MGHLTKALRLVFLPFKVNIIRVRHCLLAQEGRQKLVMHPPSEGANPLKCKYQNGMKLENGRRESVKFQIPK